METPHERPDHCQLIGAVGPGAALASARLASAVGHHRAESAL
ncbi:hypothetical protein [Brachybacterium sacelli]